jgi:hypothetical protein
MTLNHHFVFWGKNINFGHLGEGEGEVLKRKDVDEMGKEKITWLVEQYRYLGVIITNDGRIDKEINNRIKKANKFIMR